MDDGADHLKAWETADAKLDGGKCSKSGGFMERRSVRLKSNEKGRNQERRGL